MKKLLLFILLYPAIIYGQNENGYTKSLTEITALPDGSTALIINPALKIKIPESMAKAKLTITAVASAELPNIKVTYANDTTKKIPATQESGNLVFDFKDHLELASGKFQVFYKNHSKGKLQFEFEKAPDGTKPASSNNNLTTYIGALANANFVGNNKFLSNLTPNITLGAITTLIDKKVKWSLDINPYIGGQINTRDSASFIPALMLGGRAGLVLNNYLTWHKKEVQFTYMPFGFGLKLIPNLKDSNTVILQHNLRTGVAFQYANLFLMSLQYTHGFHNSTSESKRFYNKIFSKASTDISYLTITGQFFTKDVDNVKNYFFIEWRGLLSKKNYAPFTNNTIITFGFRKDLSPTSAFPAGTRDNKRYSSSRPGIL